MNGVARSASIHSSRFHPYMAALFASASGTFMWKAGEVFSRQSWAAARPFALAGGLAIQLALFTERRGVRVRGSFGSKGGRALAYQLGASGLILTAGVAIASVGHLSSLSGWWPVGVTLIPSALLLLPAAHLNRQAAAARMVESSHRGERTRP